jgi:alpha-L-fucosidase
MKDEVMLTRKGNNIYVHLYKDIQTTAVILKPLDILPKKAILLNNGQELEARVDLLPSHHRERPYLRIRNIPTNEITDEVLILKLEFDESVNE